MVVVFVAVVWSHKKSKVKVTKDSRNHNDDAIPTRSKDTRVKTKEIGDALNHALGWSGFRWAWVLNLSTHFCIGTIRKQLISATRQSYGLKVFPLHMNQPQ